MQLPHVFKVGDLVVPVDCALRIMKVVHIESDPLRDMGAAGRTSGRTCVCEWEEDGHIIRFGVFAATALRAWKAELEA